MEASRREIAPRGKARPARRCTASTSPSSLPGRDSTRPGIAPTGPSAAGIPERTRPTCWASTAAIERDPASLGRSVLIVDDGFEELTAGLAERLATEGGAKVGIVSPRPWWGEALYRTYDIAHVMPRLRAAGVQIEAQVFVEAIERGAATLYDVWNPKARRVVEADTVVLALARSPVDGRRLWFSSPQIGDCLAPRSVEAVIYEGEEARARNLSRRFCNFSRGD